MADDAQEPTSQPEIPPAGAAEPGAPVDARFAGHDDPLPPVTPPSAGFIVQLFLVPAVIVIAIVGVWAMFGRIAATQQKWETLVEELKTNNKHRRDRAMLALAQMIEADRSLGDEGRGLAENPAVCEAMVEVFEQRLAGEPEVDEVRTPDGADDSKINSPTRREAERLKSQSTTARALGLLDDVDVVAPALIDGMDDEHDAEVRKDSVNSISVIANRATETGAEERLSELVGTPGLLERLVEITEEADPVMRDSATFALGLLPGEPSRERLEVLAEHRSRETRVNAAIGLARQDSTAGLPVFESVLADATAIPEGEATAPPSRFNPLLVTLLAATFTTLILAAANTGAVRYAGTGLSVLLLIGAGVVAARTAPEQPASNASQANRDELRERELDRVLALHAVQNTLEATKRLSERFTPEERSRLVALVEPIADTHPEARIRLDASTALTALRAANE